MEVCLWGGCEAQERAKHSALIEHPSPSGVTLEIPGFHHTRRFLGVCPAWLGRQHEISVATKAYNWAEKHQMSLAFPCPTVSLLDAVSAMSAGVSSGERDRMERERKKAKDSNGKGRRR